MNEKNQTEKAAGERAVQTTLCAEYYAVSDRFAPSVLSLNFAAYSQLSASLAPQANHRSFDCASRGKAARGFAQDDTLSIHPYLSLFIRNLAETNMEGGGFVGWE
jgi:hypothetical protein